MQVLQKTGQILFLFCSISSELFGMKIGALSGKNLMTKSKIEMNFTKAPLGTVVIFLSTRCPCSISHEEELENLYEDFAPKGFQFVGVHSNQDETELSDIEHFRSSGIHFPILDDANQQIANDYEAMKTPHAYIVSPDKKVLYMGAVSDCRQFRKSKEKFLRTALQQIIRHKPVHPSKTLTMGCMILRK